MLNKYSWFSLKQMKSYSTNFNGNGYTGGRLSHAGKWSKRIGRAGKLVGIYGFYSTVTEYTNDHKLTEFGLGYVGGSDLIGLGNIYMGGWSIGTSLGKSIVESSWYFNAVHRDSRVW
jgi:hypothetical protein